ncbi:MAG TPA: 3-hydroxyacyl-CoA dehydrogenase/enoyl-CoA hydratase family protein [Anaerolineales bacterium]|nr:3-hydroxyacyl-CoA dehydrogenase/enoyl-CoA hydratase family protein [Anaerolineales bacterium]
MMSYTIRSAAVIGSGTMGSGIAALLAGAGIPVLLLDIAPQELTPAEAASGLTLESPAVRNRIVNGALQALGKSRPPALYSQEDLDLIRIGNLEDDLHQLANVDWVIEVIVENLKIKRALFEKLEGVLPAHAIVTSNTSGLPLHLLAEGRSDNFRRHFLGTHFFNPPRYLKLLELIPTPETDPNLVTFFRQFGSQTLGKGVVIAKDTPNFVGNRIGTAAGAFDVAYAIQNGYTIAETDAIAGPTLGRPKSAVFRLMDLVGLDVMAFVTQNAAKALPTDPYVAIPAGRPTEVVQAMLERKWLGNKTKAGFYKEVSVKGKKEFWTLNLQTLEHEAPSAEPRFESIGKTRKIADTGARLKALIQHTDRAASFAWHSIAFLLMYSARCVPEISDEIVGVDNAIRWGFGHEMGPFEIWEALGVAETAARMEQDGYPVADWVKQMLASGHTHFYRHTAGQSEQYSPVTARYQPIAQPATAIFINRLPAERKELAGNGSAALHDLGDQVLLLEFRDKANTLSEPVFDIMDEAMQRLEHGAAGLVIGNQGALFSGGANLDMNRLMMSGKPPVEAFRDLIVRGQKTFMRLRSASKPVVSAPFDRALGGGAEVTMHADRIVAHIELYMGLVEAGVGLVPGWGGCKELLRRVVNPHMKVKNADPLPPLQKVFEAIGLAQVSSSAVNAREIGFLQSTDRIVMNRDLLLGTAKQEVLHMANSGYTARPHEKIYAAGRDVQSAIELYLLQMLESGYASAHDVTIGKTLANILCGGNLAAPAWVSPWHILELEQEGITQLMQTEKTMERIMHMLTVGKPLRN